jgi:hypothetical protein
VQAVPFFVFTSPLQFQRSRSMRHLMPIITPRLIMRPPTLGDLDSIQTAKEEAWPDLQRWMTWALDNQRSRQAMEVLFGERWITRSPCIFGRRRDTTAT